MMAPLWSNISVRKLASPQRISLVTAATVTLTFCVITKQSKSTRGVLWTKTVIATVNTEPINRVEGHLLDQEVPLSRLREEQQLIIEGWIARQPEIDALYARIAAHERECDRLWLAAFSPEDRREYLLNRLDRALTEAPESVWDRIEKDLAQMRGNDITQQNTETRRRAA